MADPRIAFIDIETAPINALVWDMHETNVAWVLEPTSILCFAVKWAHEKRVKTYAVCDYPGYDPKKSTDANLAKDLWKVLDEADVVVAHNGDSFDIKKIKARLVVHGLTPPSPFKTFDTLRVARGQFGFDSNKLDNIGKYLSLGRKLPHTGMHLWVACMSGDPKAWRLMKRYNAQDVRLLESVYHKIKAWAPRHPDLRAFTGASGCPTCSSKNVQCRGFNVAKTRKTQRMQCRDCGHWYSGRVIHEPKVWDA